MADQLLQLYSQNHWAADGVTTDWNFTFQGGYISQAHVKAYKKSPEGDITALPLVPADFLGPYQVRIVPAVEDGYVLVVYRDTPKDNPLVNFQDGAQVTEPSLDLIARQAVFIGAEVLDGSGQTLIVDELGFKSMKQKLYTGPSIVTQFDNGRAHYKEDGSQVALPNSLNTAMLTTIVNYSEDPMPLSFIDGSARQQGAEDTTPYADWLIYPWNTVTVTKIKSGQWLLSGKATPA